MTRFNHITISQWFAKIRIISATYTKLETFAGSCVQASSSIASFVQNEISCRFFSSIKQPHRPVNDSMKRCMLTYRWTKLLQSHEGGPPKRGHGICAVSFSSKAVRESKYGLLEATSWSFLCWHFTVVRETKLMLWAQWMLSRSFLFTLQVTCVKE